MSVEAITWALRTPIAHSPTKFLLVALANSANPRDFTVTDCSVTYLCEATSQDRKTVAKGIKWLVEAGYLRDTGRRCGATLRVPVYQLVNPASDCPGTPAVGNSPKTALFGNAPDSGAVSTFRNEPEVGAITGTNRSTPGPVSPIEREGERGTIGGEGKGVSSLSAASHANTEHQATSESERGSGGKRPAGKRRAADEPDAPLDAAVLAAEPARKERTLAHWLAWIKVRGEKAIPPGDSVFQLAERMGIDSEMLTVAWLHFRDTYTQDRKTKRYTAWRDTFRNSVRNNWFRLWELKGAGVSAAWTSNGLQARNLYAQPAKPAPDAN